MKGDQDIFGTHALAVVFATGFIVLACVLLHYEVFGWLTRVLAGLHIRIRRRRILLLILGLLALHVVEIWLFGIGYFLLLDGQSFSRIHGSGGELLDLVYFSAVVYTTLGLGDLVPAGAIRFMTGTEALTGFVLITWSASFTFLEMQKFWKND
jgi:Ion channel